ncbi:peptidase [Alkalisalibacterium limincola]|uniref:Peptidase n=1 Tax=Alkalisalibacterium limincola TaxID=2699169 RepID=A0A5C8KZG2_9GAMM|nr:peptidase [Alkalisalibacterium limincola]TXK65842.1 peptidase [Alkalisalibacterium limincola]
MTYCVGLFLDDGLVMLADTRTNAGVDNISSFAKLQVFSTPGDRMIATMTAGSLAVSQAVMNLIQEGVQDPETGETATIYTVPSMFRAASLVGEAVRQVYRTHGKAMQEHGLSFDVSILLGGQLHGRTVRLFQIYSAGNFIEATGDTPFLQIGEHKYGKPILDRAVTSETNLIDGIKLALISMDSTLRSNLSVGLPMDLLVYRKDHLEGPSLRRITEDDEYFLMLRKRWSEAISEAHRQIPQPDWGF